MEKTSPETVAPDAAPGSPPVPAKGQTAITCTRGLSEWLANQNLSIAFTSYQSGRLYLMGVGDKGKVHFHERYFARAMGLWTDNQRLLLSTIFQLWRFENVLKPGQVTDEGFDRLFVPRHAQTTGDLDIHDVSVLPDGRIIFVNTAYSCLATLSAVHSFRPYWKPRFISRLAREDRCHLNGLAMLKGKPSAVTAICRSDVVNGWRDRRAEGGSIIDVETGEIITEKLSMPHSPRWYNGKLWVLNSGTGYLGKVDPATGAFEPVTFCPGFLRGLQFYKGFAFVGLSLPRNGTFSGLKLDEELKRRDAEPWCGLQIINLKTGDIVHWVRLEGEVTELFDLAIMPGVRRPASLGFMTSEIHDTITFEDD